MNYPSKENRSELASEITGEITESCDRFNSIMETHLHVLEAAIKEFVLEVKDTISAPHAERLRVLIDARVRAWLLGSDTPGNCVYFSDWLYDWLYPRKEAEAEGTTRDFEVVSDTALFQDQHGTWVTTKKFQAVSADKALHLAALEIAGDPKSYLSGDSFHKEYMRARSTMRTVERVATKAQSADGATSAQDIMRGAM